MIITYKVNRPSDEKYNIPVQIFGTKLSPSEAITKYLKENKQLSFSAIGKLLNRDQRGIWGSYARAKQKQSQPFEVTHEHTVPVSIFTERKFSLFEILVHHLVHEQEYKIAHISHLLNRKTSTIWTIYNRAKKKNA